MCAPATAPDGCEMARVTRRCPQGSASKGAGHACKRCKQGRAAPASSEHFGAGLPLPVACCPAATGRAVKLHGAEGKPARQLDSWQCRRRAQWCTLCFHSISAARGGQARRDVQRRGGSDILTRHMRHQYSRMMRTLSLQAAILGVLTQKTSCNEPSRPGARSSSHRGAGFSRGQHDMAWRCSAGALALCPPAPPLQRRH